MTNTLPQTVNGMFQCIILVNDIDDIDNFDDTNITLSIPGQGWGLLAAS